MKKIIAIILCIISCLCLFSGCGGVSYCNPCGKVWYNNQANYPHILKPLDVSYDGLYTIEISEDGKVVFTLEDGQVLNGVIEVSRREGKPFGQAKIEISFRNNKTKNGSCYKNGKSTYLSFFYNGKYYSFGSHPIKSKQEFDEYRNEFVGFLRNVYQTGQYPTQDEIESNVLYRQFANYYQIDPCCGGPIVYSVAEKVAVQAFEINDGVAESTLTFTKVGQDEPTACYLDYNCMAVLVKKDGTFEKLQQPLLGDCLVVCEDLRYVEAIYYFE